MSSIFVHVADIYCVFVLGGVLTQTAPHKLTIARLQDVDDINVVDIYYIGAYMSSIFTRYLLRGAEPNICRRYLLRGAEPNICRRYLLNVVDICRA